MIYSHEHITPAIKRYEDVTQDRKPINRQRYTSRTWTQLTQQRVHPKPQMAMTTIGLFPSCLWETDRHVSLSHHAEAYPPGSPLLYQHNDNAVFVLPSNQQLHKRTMTKPPSRAAGLLEQKRHSHAPTHAQPSSRNQCGQHNSPMPSHIPIFAMIIMGFY